jgi:SAM-dependent methyltransferase
VDLPHSFTIRESSHRIHNPFTSDKLATLGQALNPPPGTRMLDLACGSGEMLCTWARDHQVTGTGINISTVFIAAAHARAVELHVDGQVSFVHGDASGYVASEPVGMASCIGAMWIGGGVRGTVELLRRSLRPAGVMLIDEPYWRQEPPGQATVEGCHASSRVTSCRCWSYSNGSPSSTATLWKSSSLIKIAGTGTSLRNGLTSAAGSTAILTTSCLGRCGRNSPRRLCDMRRTSAPTSAGVSLP